MTPARFTRSVPAIAAGLLLGFSGQLSAHHAFAAEFDGEQPIEIKGLVSKITWVNPHSWLYVDVKDAKGQVTNWGFEFGTPVQPAAKRPQQVLAAARHRGCDQGLPLQERQALCLCRPGHPAGRPQLPDRRCARCAGHAGQRCGQVSRYLDGDLQ
jgi:hypothetical protein